MKPEVDEGAVRITQQFRARDAMVYDLRGKAGPLTLRVTGRAGEDGSPIDWRSFSSRSPDQSPRFSR